MPAARQYPQDFLYGFPLFSSKKSKGYLLSCDSIRVADPWSLLNYTIRVSHDSVTNHPLNKGQQAYLLELLEQEEYFYKTAETAKGTVIPMNCNSIFEQI